MTRYTVVWDSGVEVAFVEAWIEGDSQLRAALSEVANWADRNLKDSPELMGELDPDQARFVAVPLSASHTRASVAYKVSSEDRIVRIIRLTIRGR
jgi:hypothetical protein